jgi:hypothetical protein
MAMIVLSSPATLTGAEEKKTGPSRFIEDFLTELQNLRNLRLPPQLGRRRGRTAASLMKGNFGGAGAPHQFQSSQRDWLNEPVAVESPGSGSWCETQVEQAGND